MTEYLLFQQVFVSGLKEKQAFWEKYTTDLVK